MAHTVMIWIAICLPVMVLAIAIATLPIIWAMVHERRYGSAEKPGNQPFDVMEHLRLRSIDADMTVCSVCSSVVADLNCHRRAAHDSAA